MRGAPGAACGKLGQLVPRPRGRVGACWGGAAGGHAARPMEELRGPRRVQEGGWNAGQEREGLGA